MALTLAEAAKLSNDTLLKGVIETTVKDSPILQRLPFIEVVGNALTYNRENALASAGFYDVGDTWAESTPTFTQLTASLKILGGDADVDNYVKATRSNVQDIEAAVIELKAKALRHKFEDTFIYGDTSTDSKAFDGLKKLINTGAASNQVVAMGATGATLTLEKLDELVDAIKGQKPDLLLMSRRSRRKLTSLMRALGSVEYGLDELGQQVQRYNGIPVGVSDWVLDTHTVAASLETGTTGGTNSTIYALAFGEGAIAGISAPGLMKVESLGSLETKDATRTRVKWYVGLADFSAVKRAALIGVQD
ncbi:MAG: phage major capsid protein [Chloroflexi bacterium]|nr:phage major capsid protein [Chloroflexota bacterium]